MEFIQSDISSSHDYEPAASTSASGPNQMMYMPGSLDRCSSSCSRVNVGAQFKHQVRTLSR